MTALMFFCDEWSGVARSIDRTLARRRVPRDDREDILQETAFRLYRAWDLLDPARPVEPYARAIALNVWHAQGRGAFTTREVLGAVPDSVSVRDDVEATCVARDDLRRVGRALQALGHDQQKLLREAAAEEISPTRCAPAPVADAVRMARMRARKQLRAVLAEPVPVAVAV